MSKPEDKPMKKWPDKARPVIRPSGWSEGYCQRCKRYFDYELNCCPDCYLRETMQKQKIEKTIEDYEEWKKKR